MFTSFDKRMFQKAKEVAETSTYRLHSIGCVITYKKKIISQAANSCKSHPMQKEYNRYRKFNRSKKPIHDGAHAEILALSHVPYPIEQQIDWSKVKIYIYRISPGHESQIGLAKPCLACMQAIKDKGIKELYYTGDDSFIYERLETE